MALTMNRPPAISLASMQIHGCNVMIVDGMNEGTIRFRPMVGAPNGLLLLTSSKTFMWLNSTFANSTVLDIIEDDVKEAKDMVTAVVKDYRRFAPGGRIPETRKPTRKTNDRYEVLTEGLTTLASQLSMFTNGKRVPTDEQARMFAVRYSELARTRSQLAALLLHADGLLEVVQAQVRDILE